MATRVARRPFDRRAAVRHHEGDEPHDYFADGLVEDIITNLSKIPGLFVIARNSSFGFRGEKPIRAQSPPNYAFATCCRAACGSPGGD